MIVGCTTSPVVLVSAPKLDMNELFLSDGELANLSGRTQKAAQARWLRKNRFEFVVRADGAPRILRDHVRARLGAMHGDKPSVTIEPDWSAI